MAGILLLCFRICGQFSPGQHDAGIYGQDPVLETGEQIPLHQPRAIVSAAR